MTRVIIVLLRQPNRRNKREMRTDPFWEFGSFGCTGCHHKNLLNPKKSHKLAGARLAFVQGGRGEVRLVLLTPPITVVHHKVHCEVRWRPARTFRYERAPLVVDNEGRSQFPFLLKEFADRDRTTLAGCFSSAFRTRRHPLPTQVGDALARRWERYVSNAPRDSFIRTYEQALPFEPPLVDGNRDRTYRMALRHADGATGRKACAR